jgi:hypothetical protein
MGRAWKCSRAECQGDKITAEESTFWDMIPKLCDCLEDGLKVEDKGMVKITQPRLRYSTLIDMRELLGGPACMPDGNCASASAEKGGSTKDAPVPVADASTIRAVQIQDSPIAPSTGDAQFDAALANVTGMVAAVEVTQQNAHCTTAQCETSTQHEAADYSAFGSLRRQVENEDSGCLEVGFMKQPVVFRLWRSRFAYKFPGDSSWDAYHAPLNWSVVTLVEDAGVLKCNCHSGLCPCKAAVSWLLNCESRLSGKVGDGLKETREAEIAMQEEEDNTQTTLLGRHKSLEVSNAERAYLEYQRFFCKWDRGLMAAVAAEHVHRPCADVDMLQAHEDCNDRTKKVLTLGYWPNVQWTQKCRCGCDVDGSKFSGFLKSVDAAGKSISSKVALWRGGWSSAVAFGTVKCVCGFVFVPQQPQIDGFVISQRPIKISPGGMDTCVTALHMSALSTIEKSIYPYKKGISIGVKQCLEHVKVAMPRFMQKRLCSEVLAIMIRAGYFPPEVCKTGPADATVWDGCMKLIFDFRESKLSARDGIPQRKFMESSSYLAMNVMLAAVKRQTEVALCLASICIADAPQINSVGAELGRMFYFCPELAHAFTKDCDEHRIDWVTASLSYAKLRMADTKGGFFSPEAVAQLVNNKKTGNDVKLASILSKCGIPRAYTSKGRTVKRNKVMMGKIFRTLESFYTAAKCELSCTHEMGVSRRQKSCGWVFLTNAKTGEFISGHIIFYSERPQYSVWSWWNLTYPSKLHMSDVECMNMALIKELAAMENFRLLNGTGALVAIDKAPARGMKMDVPELAGIFQHQAPRVSSSSPSLNRWRQHTRCFMSWRCVHLHRSHSAAVRNLKTTYMAHHKQPGASVVPAMQSDRPVAFEGRLLPVCATASCVLTADSLEEEEVDPKCASLFMHWATALTNGLCHVFAGNQAEGEFRYSRREVAHRRTCAVRAERYESDPTSEDWFCHPDSLVVHMLHCEVPDGTCKAGCHCKVARIVLGHLYSCEKPDCALCLEWCKSKSNQTGMNGRLLCDLAAEERSMTIMHLSLPAYNETYTSKQTSQLPISGRRRFSPDGELMFPLDAGPVVPQFARGIDGFHAKGHTKEICKTMDTGRVKQLLRRADLKKGQTGEQLHSAITPCTSFLNSMHFFNHHFCMQMILTVFNEELREAHYRWWCKRTCRCGMSNEPDEEWELGCTCNGAYIGLDAFRRLCDVRSLAMAPLPRPQVPTPLRRPLLLEPLPSPLLLASQPQPTPPVLAPLRRPSMLAPLSRLPLLAPLSRQPASVPPSLARSPVLAPLTRPFGDLV